MISNLSHPATVPLCYESVNGSCVRPSSLLGSRLILLFGSPRGVISILPVKQLHSPTSVIPSLACADFLVRVTVMPFIKVRSVDSCRCFGPSFCTFHTYLPVTVPLVYPTKFTVTVSGTCVSISRILLLICSGAMFHTGIYDDGLEELVSTLSCVGGCQTVVNQDWVLIDFLFFFIPTLKSRVAKRERKAAKTLGITVVAFMISQLPYTIKVTVSGWVFKDSSSTVNLFSEQM
ncbi:unnamed protein product [Nyctereutes procyonoides]|uniref:(raccoon dog) hypothetical protein n=1 Tax=Nyctereutes procyonoides TaxID=34880 RepID=A0A811YFP5_NYCPR|nr:unnamed protein product [Nyctereutes procyonoides]